VRQAGNVNLGLAGSDRLDQDHIEPGGIKDLDHAGRGLGQPAERAARGHGADKDIRVAAEIAQRGLGRAPPLR
jgi:hypothetical protein